MPRGRGQSLRKGRRKGFRRQFGLDRSGPPPRQTRPGQPLRPWTIPNLVGYLRLAGLPVFLVIAFSSGDGRDAAAAVIFWLIAVGDYVDGFLARATGQYSRMGALLDPLVDRLTILCGAAVCWHFELLPRWALAVLAVRELVTLILAQVYLRRVGEIEINWLGRIGVFFVMAGIFWALAVEGWVPTALFVFGLVAAIAASFVYVRAGLRRLRTSAARKA
ncbi:MAG TPA: CDP-alcohol phosphatidyltransferase family protein [Solirubrobacterales bacterium]|nr:CDP-alcohol phosphatidyltransferase family protein [Solirubrobacterales bacterium]